MWGVNRVAPKANDTELEILLLDMMTKSRNRNAKTTDQEILHDVLWPVMKS
jgi:hypothetical protein